MKGVLLLGILLLFDALISYNPGHGGTYRGIGVPDWIWLPEMVGGGVFVAVALRSWWRGDYKKFRKPWEIQYTPDEIDQARRDLARMYEREHGRPPELWSDPTEDAASLRPEPTEPPLATPSAPEEDVPSPPSLPSLQAKRRQRKTKTEPHRSA